MPAMETEPKTLRSDAAENRKRLLAAAAVVFAEHGLDGSVEEVARAAGVGMGTLYRRFPTKDALIGELVRELLEEVVGLARDALKVEDGLGLEQFLYAMAAAQYAHRGCLSRLWSDPQSTELKDECRALIATLLADAQEHGRVSADANLGDLDLLLWSLLSVIERSQPIGSGAWRRLVAIVLAGLRPSSEPLAEPALTERQIAIIRKHRRTR